jgi:hypothetical protein
MKGEIHAGGLKGRKETSVERRLEEQGGEIALRI